MICSNGIWFYTFRLESRIATLYLIGIIQGSQVHKSFEKKWIQNAIMRFKFL